MSANITVYTCITSAKDSLQEEQVKGDARWVAYKDIPQKSKTWEILPAYDKFTDPRRNSRIQKILAHQYIDTEYSIYIDGNMRLLVTPEELIKKHLADSDLAVYKHPNRDCLYEEAVQCAVSKLDDPEVIIQQVKAYEERGFAKHKGLCECGVILRRHTQKVEEFNNAWWSEYCRHSRRDQLSFNYITDRVGIQFKTISDYNIVTGPYSAKRQSGDLSIITHNHFI